MTTRASHWTERSVEDFLHRIASDFIVQIEKAMEAEGINQAAFATRLGVTEGRVSQLLNSPGNLTLRMIVECAKALNRKVAIVEYNDQGTTDGPVNSEIFAQCWYKAGAPTDFFSLEEVTNTNMWELRPSGPNMMATNLGRNGKTVTNSTASQMRPEESAGTDYTIDIAPRSKVVVNG
jgi:transcriptional regulator with XRE-family HTH domain